MEEGILARRVLYSCGKVAAAILTAEPPRKRGRGKVVKLLQDAGALVLAPTPKFLSETERLEARVDTVEAVIAAIQTDRQAMKKGVTVDIGRYRCVAQTHGRVCGGTSVKRSNRIERGAWDETSRQFIRENRIVGWKFEKRRAEKGWRWQAFRRKSKKLKMENHEILLSP